MASSTLKTTKDGRQFYEIRVSPGRGKQQLSCRWYVPDGWSKKSIEKELANQKVEFERKVKSGEIVSRSERKAQEAAKAAELAKLKTVRQYVEGVFMPMKLLSVSENTRALYQHFFDRHIFPVIGDLKLVDITPAMLNKLLLDFQKAGYAHSSQVLLHGLLRSLFEMAFDDDSIPLSPMLKVKVPRQPKDVKVDDHPKSLTEKELNYVLECAAKEPLKWQVYITLAADTGCRRGELCGLQWQDIDSKNGTITIQRNLQYSIQKGTYTTTPKSRKTRTVDIGADTLHLLRQLRKEQASSCISQWVFTQDGSPEPMCPKTPTGYFTAFGKKYDVPNFHPHLLRHTSASIAMTNGADIVSVSQRLGHSSIRITERYTHANEESIRRAGQAVRNALKAENE